MNIRRRRILLPAIPLTLAAIVPAGCATTTPATTSTSASESSVVETASVDSDLTVEAVIAANEDATVTRDDEWSDADAIDLDLDSEGDSLAISEAGVYRLSGTLSGGVVVAAPRTPSSC